MNLNLTFQNLFAGEPRALTPSDETNCRAPQFAQANATFTDFNICPTLGGYPKIMFQQASNNGHAR